MAVDPQQAALAAAIATHGSAGIQQAADAANTGAAGKQAALSGAAGRAGLINAPTDFLKQAATQVAAPYNNAASSAANTSAAINSYTNTLKGANDNFMGQLKGALGTAQSGVNQAASAANLGQMLQLYQLVRQQSLDAPKLQAAQDATDLANNQKSVINRILLNPDKAVSGAVMNVISSNQSQTLPEALAAANDSKALAKLGVKDPNVVRQALTEYYTDPTTFQSLQQSQQQAAQNAYNQQAAIDSQKRSKSSAAATAAASTPSYSRGKRL